MALVTERFKDTVSRKEEAFFNLINLYIFRKTANWKVSPGSPSYCYIVLPHVRLLLILKKLRLRTFQISFYPHFHYYFFQLPLLNQLRLNNHNGFLDREEEKVLTDKIQSKAPLLCGCTPLEACPKLPMIFHRKHTSFLDRT